MVKAYPTIPEESRDRLAKNQFLEAVEDCSVREGVNRACPKNLNEAIQAALETENFQRVEQQRALDGRPAKMARAIDSGTEQRFSKLEGKLINLTNQSMGRDQRVVKGK